MSRNLRRPLLAGLALIVLSGLGLAACGPVRPELDGTCESFCDCKRGDAPLRCPGEWLCNTDHVCEYTCSDNLCSGEVTTCPAYTECNGTFCSAREGIQCPPL